MVPQGPLLEFMGQRIVENPLTVVAADIMGFPPSKTGFKYVVVFQDIFSRWVQIKPLRRADGRAIAAAFQGIMLYCWGTLDYLLVDNGKEFINQPLRKILEKPGAKLVTIRKVEGARPVLHISPEV